MCFNINHHFSNLNCFKLKNLNNQLITKNQEYANVIIHATGRIADLLEQVKELKEKVAMLEQLNEIEKRNAHNNFYVPAVIGESQKPYYGSNLEIKLDKPSNLKDIM
jgi:hypothetical protein